MRSTELSGRSLVGLFLPLFCIVDQETRNGSMPAAGELIMLKKTAYRAWCRSSSADDDGVDLCLLVLRPRGSMVLQGSHIMNTLGIL